MNIFKYDEKFKKVIELFKEKTRKDCYKVITTSEAPDLLDDKLGGVPYLPVNEEWPLGKNGKPLSLLLQVNLKNINLKNFPNSGILEIFTDSPLKWPCEYVIKVFNEGLDYQTNLTNIDNNKTESEKEELVIKIPTKIILEKTIDYMPKDHIYYREYLIDIVNSVYNQKFKKFWDVQSFFASFKDYDFGKYPDTGWIDAIYEDIEYLPISIGGYANFTQTDVRLDNPKLKNKTECILKLDNYADFENFYIGDSGIIFALITKNDLKNSNFNKTYIDWDCC